MSEHSKTPWRVFTNPDGTKLVGIGEQDGEGILDCGFGVWSWNDPEGIANANLVVKAVNCHDALVKKLEEIHDITQDTTLHVECWQKLQNIAATAASALASIKELS
jgi:hypothetical protein